MVESERKAEAELNGAGYDGWQRLVIRVTCQAILVKFNPISTCLPVIRAAVTRSKGRRPSFVIRVSSFSISAYLFHFFPVCLNVLAGHKDFIKIQSIKFQ